MVAPQTPKKKRIVDRFIPARDGHNLQAAYAVASGPLARPGTSSGQLPSQQQEPVGGDNENPSDEGETYSALLRAELFSEVPASVPISRSSSSNSVAGTAAGTSTTSPDRRQVRSLPTTPRRRREYVTKNMFSYSPSRKRTSPQHPAAAENSGEDSTSPVRPESQHLLLKPRRKARHVENTPYKVLDAPELADDFYLNLVDWGSENKLAVGLGSSVYMWDANSGQVHQIASLGVDDSVSSVSWVPSGPHLAVGTAKGYVQIWDVETSQRLRQMPGHRDRASSLSWNQHVLTSGSRDFSIIHRDVRAQNPFISRLTSHSGEVCGLRWNTDLDQLASGCNDNKLHVWQGMSTRPLYYFNEHRAAVKALAWSPHQRGLLASGGGTNDRHIWFWNTLTGRPVQSRDTGSQVCSLAWSLTSRELVSTHGYSQNHVQIWKYPTMQPVATLTGHTFRVLYLSMSPDGSSIVTGAGDETLRLWNIFESNSRADSSSALNMYTQLR